MEAFKADGSDIWRVSSCSRTQPADQASEEMRVLRAWKNGQPLVRRVSGQIVDRRTPATNTVFQVRLIEGNRVFETATNSRGEFEFANLDAAVYQVQLVQPTVFNPFGMTADLTRSWCARMIIPLGP